MDGSRGGDQPNRAGIKVVQLNVLLAITAKNFISDFPYTSIINQHQGGQKSHWGGRGALPPLNPPMVSSLNMQQPIQAT